MEESRRKLALKPARENRELISMPVIQIIMLKGRTAEQKRRLAARMTDVMVEEAGANRDAVVVTMVEVERDAYARGGVLIADRDSGGR